MDSLIRRKAMCDQTMRRRRESRKSDREFASTRALRDGWCDLDRAKSKASTACCDAITAALLIASLNGAYSTFLYLSNDTGKSFSAPI
jgi:hypothetical protein